MQISAKKLAQLLGASIEGNPDAQVHAASKIEEGTEGTICFLANPKYETHVYTTKASILLVSNDFVPSQKVEATLLRVSDVYASVAVLLKTFGKRELSNKGVSEQASVDASVEIGENTSIGAFSVIEKNAQIGSNCQIYPQVYIGENVRLGNNITLYPGVRIYHDCSIGDNCILHANVVIGGDGFGFAPKPDGTFEKIAQIGNVLIENDVEIGANTTIDRATMGSTIIRAGAKLDNLIMVAHNVEIGKNTVIAAQAGIAGSTKVGENVLIGGQVGLVGHLKIPNGTKIQAQSGVTKSIKKENQALYGSPAIEYNNYLRSFAAFKNLPELVKKVRDLDKKIRE